MANGEIYHREGITAAHRSLPFGTVLLLRNPKTNIDVVVVITDRGPFSHKFSLDLSEGAARELGIKPLDGWAWLSYTIMQEEHHGHISNATRLEDRARAHR